VHEPVQVAVPFDQNTDDAPLWSKVEPQNVTDDAGDAFRENFVEK